MGVQLKWRPTEDAQTNEFVVVKYDRQGRFVGIISGRGRRKGNTNTVTSRAIAERDATRLLTDFPDGIYRVQHVFANVDTEIAPSWRAGSLA